MLDAPVPVASAGHRPLYRGHQLHCCEGAPYSGQKVKATAKLRLLIGDSAGLESGRTQVRVDDESSDSNQLSFKDEHCIGSQDPGQGCRWVGM